MRVVVRASIIRRGLRRNTVRVVAAASTAVESRIPSGYDGGIKFLGPPQHAQVGAALF